ncbi:tail sheath protein [Vibrio phage 1.158.O._10N.261.45.E12]|nr:tail sheath protein [Vibrio phage 1.158.O._10N.261.45.E12]AUR92639.1 tail sheath protein [Vibrio phage 1.175.O._10N.261.55.B3]
MGAPKNLRAAGRFLDVFYQDFNAGTAYSLPQRIAIFAQGSESSTYSTDKFEITSNQDVADKMGFGSPAHLVAKELFPANGGVLLGVGVTVYPLPNEAGGVQAAADITPAGTQTVAAQYFVRVGGVTSNAFTALKDETPAEIVPKIVTAINGNLDMPVIATDETTKVTITAKHKGTTGNDLVVEVIGTPQGVTFATTAMTGGLVDPDIDVATGQVGDIWETLIINQLGTVAHDKLQVFNDARWNQLVAKPFVAYYGTSETDETVLKAYTANRKQDKANGVMPCPGSSSAPWIIAARAVGRIANQANNHPAMEYRNLRLDTIVPGKDGEQWSYDERDLAWKAGVSSTQIIAGSHVLDNTLTFYHPDGQVNPAFGKQVYHTKLYTVMYNVNLIINSDEWSQVALIPDDQVSTSPDARKPNDLKTQLYVLADNLADDAIISDAEFTKANIVVGIDDQNPNRVNVTFPVKLSGNWDIISVDLPFGFYLGGA